MTIERGSAWGERATPPPDLVRVADDAALAAMAAAAHTRGERLVAQVDSGDVLRTLGLHGPRPAAQQLSFAFDLGFAALDDDEARPFVAHLAAHRRGWAGEAAVAMNGAWLGAWYLGPRAHPNDGLLDITWGSLPLVQRLLARRRLPTGSHLPHPGLHTERRVRWEHRFDRPTGCFVDGRPVGRHRQIAVWLELDCFTLFA